jgi:subtilase-type serine protease
MSKGINTGQESDGKAMALRHWQPHRVAALVIVILLWPAVLICLSHPAVAQAQSAGCSISSPDVPLYATCVLDDAGNLTGSFPAPLAPTSTQTQTPTPDPCQSGLCTNQITVSACADASSALCASAPFSIETNIVAAPESASPTLAQAVAETGPCSAACRSGRTVGFHEPAITVELTVGNPVITLSPSHGSTGTTVTVTGVGFAVAPATSSVATTPAATTPAATTPAATTPAASSPPPTGTSLPVPAPSNFLLPGIVAIGVAAVLVAVVVLLRRRPPNGASGSQVSPTAHVHAQVSGAMPRPVMRNAARRPAGIVRIDVHRHTVEPRIEKRTPR